MNWSADWTMLLQVGEAKPCAPPGHWVSLAADHMDSQARCLVAANAASCCALATVKTSVLVSFTPIIGVTATLDQAASALIPMALATWASVAVAASIANVPIWPLGFGAAPSP